MSGADPIRVDVTVHKYFGENWIIPPWKKRFFKPAFLGIDEKRFFYVIEPTLLNLRFYEN